MTWGVVLYKIGIVRFFLSLIMQISVLLNWRKLSKQVMFGFRAPTPPCLSLWDSLLFMMNSACPSLNYCHPPQDSSSMPFLTPVFEGSLMIFTLN